MAEKLLLLGDEAVALAAVHAGISGAYSYPGTPSSEIFEYVEGLADRFGVHAAWSANEKVAYEEALGMSFAGKRVLVSMKHVGLNVAADPFVNSAISGVNGGLVLAVWGSRLLAAVIGALYLAKRDDDMPETNNPGSAMRDEEDGV